LSLSENENGKLMDVNVRVEVERWTLRLEAEREPWNYGGTAY
jgi:hypothetical protein